MRFEKTAFHFFVQCNNNIANKLAWHLLIVEHDDIYI